jgi:peptide deformylase
VPADRPSPSKTAPIDPAALRIVTYPAEVLRQKALPLPAVTDEVRAVAERMLELMQEAEGIGLAAPQVGLPWRMFVVDIPPPPAAEGSDDDAPMTDPPTFTDGPEVYINPRFSLPQGAPVGMEEGCLSLPEIRGEVLRPPGITITALDIDGNEFTQSGAGLLARCWQHEMDHLDGVLIIDRFTQMSRIKTKAAVKDLRDAARRRR